MNRKIVLSSRIFPVVRVMALGLILLPVLIVPLRAQTSPDAQDNTPLTPYQTALLNYKTGHYDAARIAIDAAEQAQPDDIQTKLLKARILTELLDFKAAQAELESLNDNKGFTPALGEARTLAFADLCLRKRDFNGASKFYESLLSAKPNDPDLTLKLIYARINSADLITAAKYASQLKPFDPASDPLDPKHPGNPSYYFAKAALAQATGKEGEVDEDVETARTLYGTTVTNRYLKTYLEVFAGRDKGPAEAALTPSPATNAAPASPKP